MTDKIVLPMMIIKMTIGLTIPHFVFNRLPKEKE